MIAIIEVGCACGADLFVSGDRRYVSEQGSRFMTLHRGDTHRVFPICEPHPHRGRDNGTRWWERELDARSLTDQPDQPEKTRFNGDQGGVSMGV